MKAFLAAVLAVAVIGVGASFVLEVFQRTADHAYVGPGARPDPVVPHNVNAPKG